MSLSVTRGAVVALCAAMLCSTTPAWSAAQSGMAAVWVPKHVRFLYRGDRTRYSCGQLRNEIAYLLSKMGPRDLEVSEGPCPRPLGGPVPLPGVDVRMQVLVPLAQAKVAGTPAAVPAHWQKIVLSGKALVPLYGEPSRALIQQFRWTLLPLFTTRNVKYWPTGTPPHLGAEVLVPDKKG